MRLEINGEVRTVAHTTLDQLVADLTARPNAVATAVNGSFVPVSDRSVTKLKEGDRIEILSPMQGG